MTSTYIYAEHLLNLRQVTVFATLPTLSNNETRVEVSPGGDKLAIWHNASWASIELPGPIVRSPATLPSKPTEYLTFRFQARTSQPYDLESATTWTALDLAAGLQVCCVECKSIFIESISEWKDLPSGGWADMMDFWHCHKPDVPDSCSSNIGNAKGYAAGQPLGPTAGVGLVDASSFIFLPEDCSGASVRVQFLIFPAD